jgi:chemotaxis protein histidine kinase CheA
MMGGKINVQSQFGQGSMFVVQIPQKISQMVNPDQTVKIDITPIRQAMEQQVIEQPKQEESEEPVSSVEPITPVVNTFQAPVEVKSEHSKPGFIYYVLLLVLIALSVFTLWLYQKNMTTDTTPVLTAVASDTTVATQKAEPVVKPAEIAQDKSESVFLDGKPEESESAESVAENMTEPEEEIEYTEEVIEEPVVKEAPVVMDAVPGRLNT